MESYTIRNQGTRLYICVMSTHIHVEQFRAAEIGVNIESLNQLAHWYINPPHPNFPSMTKMELVRMVQRLTGDVHNDLIHTILNFKPAEKKGVAAYTE